MLKPTPLSPPYNTDTYSGLRVLCAQIVYNFRFMNSQNFKKTS